MARNVAAKPKKPTVVTPRPGPHHPGQGKGRTFHVHQLPPGFNTVQSPSHPQPWQDLPQPTGQPPYHLSLDSILSGAAINQIQASGRMVFHAVGDTGGVNTPTPQEIVARYMEADFATGGDVSGNPSFFYHLGDVVYYDGETPNYYWEFYEPYQQYPAPIVAIPGNHDGDVNPQLPEPSLSSFVRNFCATSPVHTPEAKDVPRDAMSQPNVYWTLETDLVTIIGLYSNCPEGGQLSPTQINWFQSELESADPHRKLVVAIHHPIYSAYGPHPGSQHLLSVLEQACAASKRYPDLVLTGHVHNYQRFKGPIGPNETTLVVAGAGGYNTRLHILAQEFHAGTPPFTMPGSTASLESFCDTNHGYLLLDVTKGKIHGDYFAVPNIDPSVAKLPAIKPFDSFDV